MAFLDLNQQRYCRKIICSLNRCVTYRNVRKLTLKVMKLTLIVAMLLFFLQMNTLKIITDYTNLIEGERFATIELQLSNETCNTSAFVDSLKQARQDVDTLQLTIPIPTKVQKVVQDVNLLGEQSFMSLLEAVRQMVDLSNVTVLQTMDIYGRVIRMFILGSKRTLKDIRHKTLWTEMIAYEYLLFAEEYFLAAMLRVELLTPSLKPTFKNYRHYLQARTLASEYLTESQKYSSFVVKKYREFEKDKQDGINVCDEIHAAVVQNWEDPVSRETVGICVDTISEGLQDLMDQLQVHMQENLDRDHKETSNGVGYNIMVFVIMLFVSPLIYLSIWIMVKKIQKQAITLNRKTKEVRKEKKR